MSEFSTRMGFSMEAYGALLDAVERSGYEWTFFTEDTGKPGAAILRHDIDKCINRALRMARYEAERGVFSSYFFLMRSPVYSLLEPEAIRALHEISEMGHQVGLHCDLTRLPGELKNIDEAVLQEMDLFFQLTGLPRMNAVTFHNPQKELVMRKPDTDGYLSGYDPRFMLPETHYISDSLAHWRVGDPVAAIESGESERFQILVHPIWWVWDTPILAKDILRTAMAERAECVDGYLGKSNPLWNA